MSTRSDLLCRTVQICILLGQPLVLTPVARGQEAARYAIVDIGDIGGRGTFCVAINNRGEIAGTTTDAATFDIRTFIWRDGIVEFRDPLVPGLDALGINMNESGEIVGKAYVSSGIPHGVQWLADGTPVDLGTLGGTDSIAYGINDSEQIVGQSDLSPSGYHAFLWFEGQFTDLGDLGEPASRASAINNAGQIVGRSFRSEGPGLRAFIWESGSMTDLGTLPDGGQSIAYDINDAGTVVGEARDRRSVQNAVIWEDRVIRSIHDPSVGDQSVANAVNSLGEVVGFLDVDRVSEHTSGFLWQPGGSMVDVMTLLPPNHSWRQLLYLSDINDAGEIVGYGDLLGGSNAAYRGVLITPVRPTLTLQGPLPGRAGTLNGLRVTGCTPGARITFYYSTHGGGTLVPGCNHTDGVTLQLDDPIQIGSAVANQNGIATLTRFVPTGARNLGDVLIQAVQQNGCKISQLVVKRFE